MKRLAIIGSSDLGQLIAYHASSDQQFTIAGFFDDFLPKGSSTVGGPVLGGLSDVYQSYSDDVFDCLMVGIGYKHPCLRKSCFEKFGDSIPIATLVHSSCYVDATAEVGKGSFLLPGCVLDKGVKIGDNALLNTGCIIAHDSVVGAHCFFGPGVTLAGFIDIGESCFVGVGTTIIDNVHIVSNVQTGGGAVVVSDIHDQGLYLGVPARKMK